MKPRFFALKFIFFHENTNRIEMVVYLPTMYFKTIFTKADLRTYVLLKAKIILINLKFKKLRTSKFWPTLSQCVLSFLRSALKMFLQKKYTFHYIINVFLIFAAYGCEEVVQFICFFLIHIGWFSGLLPFCIFFMYSIISIIKLRHCRSYLFRFFSIRLFFYRESILFSNEFLP